MQAGERGAKANAIGISRGGRTTKIHALVDILGRPLRLILTPGNTSDVKAADQLIGDTAGMKRLIADRGDDANSIRTTLRQQNTIPVIPGRKNRKRAIRYDETRYKEPWRIEAMFCRLRDLRRIAARYDKIARICQSAVMLAAAVAFWFFLSLAPDQIKYNPRALAFSAASVLFFALSFLKIALKCIFTVTSEIEILFAISLF